MEQISAGILAGGKSRRLGTDKAFLPLRGTSFLEETIAACAGFAEVLLSVDAPARFQQFGCRMAVDERQGFGPVEGIYQLLRLARTTFVLVVATDMPYLNATFLHRLAEEVRPDMDALVLRAAGKLEPLCSIYSKAALPFLEEMRRAGIHQIRPLYAQIRTAYVDLETLGGSTELVRNVNTPEDYRTVSE